MISWAQRWGSEVIRWVGEGTDLLFPPGCRWCRAEVDAAPHGLCATCARAFSADSDRCPRCGVAASASAGGCPRCHRTPPAWDGAMFLGGYDAELREAVLRVKRPGAEPVAEALAALLVEKHCYTLAAARLDAVVPVPMHWWRRARRATSPAEEIARAVAREAGLAVSAPLVRHRSTRMQNEVAADERAANVAGAFRTQAPVHGRRLLLVDDVVTTGATLDECCRVLRSAGAAAVFCAALARADGARAAADRGWGP